MTNHADHSFESVKYKQYKCISVVILNPRKIDVYLNQTTADQMTIAWQLFTIKSLCLSLEISYCSDIL